MGQTQVQRHVNRQGKLRLWDRPVYVGTQAASQTVTVRFDPTTRGAVVADRHEHVLRTVPLPWLTADWLWAPVPLTAQQAPSPDRSPCT